MVQYSHSRLSSFENCPQQFEYRYIQKIEVEGEGIEAFLGKRVHEILERLYHHLGRHGRPPSLSQVQKRLALDWELHWHDKIRIVRTEREPGHYLQQGERCLENYYRSHYPFEEGQTVALEKPISFQLDPEGRYRMRGIIDRLTRQSDGTYEIHDYKTSGFLPPLSRLEKDRQLALYQIGIEQSFPDSERIELVWHYLVFNKTLRLRRTREQLEDLGARTIQLIDQIEASSSYPANPGPLCRWCDYREICPSALLPASDAGNASSERTPPPEPTGSLHAVPAAPSQATTPRPPAEDAVQLSLL